MDSGPSKKSTKQTYLLTTLRVLYTVGAFAVLSIMAVWINAHIESLPNTDECLWNAVPFNGDTVVVVGTVFPEGIAERAGIKEGDIIVAINNQPVRAPGIPGNQLSLYAQTLLDKAPSGQPVPYIVERNGQRLSLTVVPQKLPPTVRIVYAIFSTLWLLIGLIVGLTRPKGYVQALFFLTGLSVFFAFSFPEGPLLTVEWTIVWTIMGSFFFPMWALFASYFPVRQKLFDSPKRQLWLLAPIVVLILTTSVLAYLPEQQLGYRIALAFLKLLCTIYFAAGVWLLFRGYGKMPTGSNRTPMKVILVGTVISACMLIYLTAINQAVVWNPLLALPTVLFLALPLSFGYVIFRYQLMDVRAVVKTALVYTLTTGTILGVYLLLAFRIGKSLGSMLGTDMEKVVQIAIMAIFLTLFEPVRRQVQHMVDRRFFPHYRDYSEHLSEYGHRMREAIGVPHIADLMTQTLAEHLNLKTVCVATVNELNHLQPIAAIGNSDIQFDAVGAECLQDMLHTSHDLIVLNARQEERLTSVVQYGFAYAIGLYAGGRLIGSILLGRRTDGKPVTGSQVPFINAVASQGASGIEAARLYEHELARRRYEEELATARRIQQSLLPSTMPELSGITINAVSHPAMEVGGDYYEVIPLSEDRFLVMIADVSGKGLPASLYMAELHGMVRVAASIRQSPRDMLTLLNNHLCKTLERGMFITATIALFDCTAGTVTASRAGHTPLVRRRGTEVETFVPQGLPLGVRSQDLFASVLEEISIEHLPGDHYILYSDGVSEAMNEDRDEFGEERLMELLAAQTENCSPEDYIENILDNIAEFRGSAEQNDDITVVVTQIEGSENDELGIMNDEIASKEQWVLA